MILFEILNKKIDYKVIDDDAYVYIASAVIKGRTIEFEGHRTLDHGFNSVWVINFREISGDRCTYNLTKNGGEFEVFAFIKQMIEELIRKRKPNFIRFTSDKGDKIRSSLYKKLIMKYAKGYELKVAADDRNQVDKFTLEKK
jgi:hypothetical protein